VIVWPVLKWQAGKSILVVLSKQVCQQRMKKQENAPLADNKDILIEL